MELVTRYGTCERAKNMRLSGPFNSVVVASHVTSETNITDEYQTIKSDTQIVWLGNYHNRGGQRVHSAAAQNSTQSFTPWQCA